MLMLMSLKPSNFMTPVTTLTLDLIVVFSRLNRFSCPMDKRTPVDRFKNLILLFSGIRVRIKMFRRLITKI